MKSVGFIDYYLDEWHANNYPKWLELYSNKNYKVKYAYGKIDSPLENGISNKQWAVEHDIELLDSIEEVVEKSDVLIVLSPDNSEMHEELCQIPLKSKKPVYVDKTFADSKKTAENLFNLAKNHGTPIFSSSALRYALEYTDYKNKCVDFIESFGGGTTLERYVIHQLEPTFMLFNAKAEKVMFLANGNTQKIVIKYFDGRMSTLLFDTDINEFGMHIKCQNSFETTKVKSDMFKYLIKSMIDFFDNGNPPVSSEDTISIMAVREAILESAKNEGVWTLVK